MDELDRLGPLDYLVVRLPAGGAAQPGFDALLALVEARQILVLDLELVRRTATGSRRVPLTGVDGLDLTAFDGASSDLLDEADLALTAAALAEGELAAVLVYEVLTLHPVVAAFERAGAAVVGEGALGADEVIAALDQLEGAAGEVAR